MDIQNVLVTGDKMFLSRYQFLFKSMSPYFKHLECLSCGELYESEILNFSKELFDRLNAVVSPSSIERFWKSDRTFIHRSQATERKIAQLDYTPDLVFHVFCMFSPFWDRFELPYAMYLDYTMSLARKNWSAWSPFKNEREFASWLNCERKAYEQAYYIFTMSNLAKSSLVKDYSIKPEKIKVVGSSGNFPATYAGEKTFGSKKILINASDFERKGGDIALAAFKQVKTAIPEAKLVVIGKKLNRVEVGIENLGNISSFEELERLFLETDLVIAPSRCDPFPTFVMEAMNYGIPCIVPANDGMPEIVDAQLNGIVIEQLTPECLADHIINLLCDTSVLTKMSKEARQKIKNKLNWNNVAKNICQTLLTKN